MGNEGTVVREPGEVWLEKGYQERLGSGVSRGGVLTQKRGDMERGRSEGVEKQCWVGRVPWECGEVHAFLVPVLGVCFGGVVWRGPVREAWVMFWVY